MRYTFLFSLVVLVLISMIQTTRLDANEPDHHELSAGHRPDGDEPLAGHLPFCPLVPEEIERFHRHLGPNVLLGVRMGEHACGVLGIPQHFGLTVVAECPDGPPHTCLIDGLQISTGATMGKENISHTTSEQVLVTIEEDATGRAVTYRLKDSTRELLAKWKAKKVHLDDQSMRIYEMKPVDLFEIEVTPPIQPK